MSTVAGSPIVAAAGGSFLLETRDARRDLHPRRPERGAAPDCRHGGPLCPRRDSAGDRPHRGQGAGRAAGAACARPANWVLPAVDIPEEYGGMGLDKVSSTLITDHISVLASFSTAFGAHIGIGTLPLVWYGTEEQKQRYLPKLATAEWIGAYALSEASSGSDAMNIRTRAVLSRRRQPLHPQRRKDVDHQLRHRRPLHRLRQNRWRESSPHFSSSARRPA